MAAQTGAYQLGPAVTGELPGEKAALAAQLLTPGVNVVHELVNEGNGNLLDLAFGVGHLAHENIAGSVNAVLVAVSSIGL